MDLRKLAAAEHVGAFRLEHKHRQHHATQLGVEDPLVSLVLRVEAEQDDAGRQIQPAPLPHHRRKRLEGRKRHALTDAEQPQIDGGVQADEPSKTDGVEPEHGGIGQTEDDPAIEAKIGRF